MPCAGFPISPLISNSIAASCLPSEFSATHTYRPESAAFTLLMISLDFTDVSVYISSTLYLSKSLKLLFVQNNRFQHLTFIIILYFSLTRKNSGKNSRKTKLWWTHLSANILKSLMIGRMIARTQFLVRKISFHKHIICYLCDK